MSMKISRFTPVLLVLLVIALVGCAGLAGEPRVIATVPPLPVEAVQPADEAISGEEDEDIAVLMTLGGEVWAENCVRCHGQLGAGALDGAPLPDLTAFSDERILASITNGIDDKMPAFSEDLTADELTAVMTYAKMLSLAISRQMVQSPTQSAAETENVVSGVVTGQVTNGTAGAALPASLMLTLHVVKSEFTEQTFDAAMNPDGSFRFEDVPISDTYQYVVIAPYGDIRFVSSIAQGSTAQPALSLPITIYDGGADVSAVQIDATSMQVMVQRGLMEVVQIVRFVNTSDRVYFTSNGESGISTSVRIPQGAQFQDWMSERYVLSEDGTQLFDDQPLLPGQSRMMHLAYSLPYTDNAAFEQTLDYALAGQMEVVVVNQGLSLSADGLNDLGVVEADNRQMTRYGGELTRAAGSSLRYEISGTPADAAPAIVQPTPVNSTAYVLIGAGIGVLSIAGGLAVRDRLKGRSQASSSSVNDLLEEIVRLDARHSEGKLNERDYQRQRAALKARLGTLMQTEQG